VAQLPGLVRWNISEGVVAFGEVGTDDRRRARNERQTLERPSAGLVSGRRGREHGEKCRVSQQRFAGNLCDEELR
jgi:hypothetical protein